jgi:stress-induced morphogen
MMGVNWWVVDYDIPVENLARRRAFYRALHKLLSSHGIKGRRSTQSVWIVDSQEIATEIHALAVSYGKSHLYSATRLD